MRFLVAAFVLSLSKSCLLAGAEEPKLVRHDKLPYMTIRTTVTVRCMAIVVPENMPKLAHRLDTHRIKMTCRLP